MLIKIGFIRKNTIIAMGICMISTRHIKKQRSAIFIVIAAAFFMIAVLVVSDAPHPRPTVAGICTVPCRSTRTAYPKIGNPDNPGGNFRPSKGLFLVADKQLRDPVFMEAVILLIAFDRNGAAGVIINRPTNVKLSAVFHDIKGLLKRNDSVYVGGPVDTGNLLMLIRTDSPLEGSHRLFDNVYISAGAAAPLKRIIDNPHGSDRFRIYAGYAGWGPGQLEYEISRGAWHLIDADTQFIFDKDASSIWPELISIQPGIQVRNGMPALRKGIRRSAEIVRVLTMSLVPEAKTTHLPECIRSCAEVICAKTFRLLFLSPYCFV